MSGEMTDGVHRSTFRGRHPRVGGRRPDDEPTILVAVPPTGPADDPVRLATILADSLRGRVLLATVVSLPSIAPYGAAKSLHGARSGRLRRLRDQWEGSRPMDHVVVVAHGVASGLLELARQRDVTMIVLGLPATRGGSRRWTRGDSSLAQLVTDAPCPVCLLERLPDQCPELLLLAVRSDEDSRLAWMVSEALFRCVSRGSNRMWPTVERSGAEPVRRWSPSTLNTRSIRRPEVSGRFALERIAVADPESPVGRSMGERALALGADVLVAPAVAEGGVWPFRRRRVPTEVVDDFPGPVVLVRGDVAERGSTE